MQSVDTVNIFMTGDAVELYPDFEHDGTRYVFDRIYSDGPKRLVEGEVCAFIDWVLDDLSGLEMCRRLRADPRTADAHITMILEGDCQDDKRRALRAAADDYIVGPLDRAMALDRVLAMREGRGRSAAVQYVTKGLLEIDMAALHARWDGRSIALRPNEFRLLRYLAENSDRVLSRGDLIAGLGKQERPIDERTVDVWIGRLRSALRRVGAKEPIRTIRSLGYVFDSR